MGREKFDSIRFHAFGSGNPKNIILESNRIESIKRQRCQGTALSPLDREINFGLIRLGWHQITRFQCGTLGPTPLTAHVLRCLTCLLVSSITGRISFEEFVQLDVACDRSMARKLELGVADCFRGEEPRYHHRRSRCATSEGR